MAKNVVFRVKPIKPALLDVDTIRLEILNENRNQGSLDVKELKKTTATWTGEKPRFGYKIHLGAKDASLESGPKDDGSMGFKKWVWLNAGVKARVITAKRAPRLAFRWPGFKPKTTPRFLGSGAGALATGPIRRPLSVNWPGIKARNWTAALYKKRKTAYRRAIDAATKRGLRKARRKQR